MTLQQRFSYHWGGGSWDKFCDVAVSGGFRAARKQFRNQRTNKPMSEAAYYRWLREVPVWAVEQRNATS